MLGALLKDGVEITNDAAQADAVIINTCSFIDAAQEESVDVILESAEVRAAQNRGQCLIVSGCLPQRFRDELPKLLPEVDAFMGIDQVTQVSEIVRQAVTRRAEKVQSPKSKAQKDKVVSRLVELEKNRTASKHENEKSIRGSEKFGKPKPSLCRQGHPPSSIPWRGEAQRRRLHPRRFLMSRRGRFSFLISERRVFGSRQSILPTSRLPKAAIIRAASASSRRCADRTAAARRQTSSRK